ncbi:MAG: oxidoreductase [Gemmatimonadetes bacterium]|nr:MAG: oxidoreductase [Gemmatimonadota bacterium]
MNVGLVGFGFGGQVFHAPIIRAVAGLHLTTIVRRSGEPDSRYPDVAFVRSVDELLARPIDLVVVVTSNTSHHPIARQCLLAGRHVVVDKPFTTTVAEAEDLVQVAKQSGRVLSVYQDRRYTGDFVTVQRVVADGVLGRIVSYEAHFDRFRLELRPGAWREQPLPDAFDVTLRYPRMRATLRGSMLAQPLAPSFAVQGTQGSFIKYGLDPQEAALKAGHTPDEANWDAEPSEMYGKLTTPEGTRTIPTTPSSFTHYYENVRDAILQKVQLAVTPEHAVAVMRGLVLAVASSQERRVLPWSASR